MVSTPLKNISQTPNRGENKKYLKPPPSYEMEVLHENILNKNFLIKKHMDTVEAAVSL